MYEEIKTDKVYIQVAKQIRKLIEENKLKIGDKLPPERTLAKEMKVSLPSVREGILVLEILGLVERKAGRGNVVKNSVVPAELDENFQHLREEESPFALLETRKVVEVGAVGYAAQRANVNDIFTIEQSVNKMESIVNHLSTSQEYEKGIQFDREFHESIARATHNPVLSRIVLQTLEKLREQLWVRLKEESWSIPGNPQKYLKEHKQILAAIRDKNPKIARKMMYVHLASIQKDLFGEEEDTYDF